MRFNLLILGILSVSFLLVSSLVIAETVSCPPSVICGTDGKSSSCNISQQQWPINEGQSNIKANVVYKLNTVRYISGSKQIQCMWVAGSFNNVISSNVSVTSPPKWPNTQCTVGQNPNAQLSPGTCSFER